MSVTPFEEIMCNFRWKKWVESATYVNLQVRKPYCSTLRRLFLNWVNFNQFFSFCCCFQFDLREERSTKLLTCHRFRANSGKPSRSRIVQLNAIVMNPRNLNYFAVGGSDQYARVYDIRRAKTNGSGMEDLPVECYAPKHLQGPGMSLSSNIWNWIEFVDMKNVTPTVYYNLIVLTTYTWGKRSAQF